VRMGLLSFSASLIIPFISDPLQPYE